MPRRLRRSQLEIIAGILTKARGGALKTQLMYRVELNFRQIENYLRLLSESGLVKQKKKMWFTTEKGEHFIKAFQPLQEIVEEIDQFTRKR